MKTTIQLFSIFLISLSISAQELEWVKTIGGEGMDIPRKVISDNSGNIYTVGTFNETVNFNPNSGSFELTSNGQADIFVQKLDSTGDFLWAISVGGIDNENLTEITLDNSGNVFITGSFMGSVDFDPSNNNFIVSSSGEYDFFILKLDTSGNFLWVKTFGEQTQDFGITINSNSNDNITITGTFTGLVDFDPGAGTHYVQAIGIGAMYILKLTNQGEFLWVKTIDVPSAGYSISFDYDTDENMLMTGTFTGTIDFDPSNNVFNLTAGSNGEDHIFILKLDANGNFIWAKKIGNEEPWQFVRAITTDLLGNVYITGAFQGTIDFDPSAATYFVTATNSATDIYLLKLNTNGNFEWVQNFGDTGNIVNEGRFIKADNQNNILISGKFGGAVDFNSSNETDILTSSGNLYNKDAFLAKYDLNGNHIWALSVGGTDRDVGGAVEFDNSENVIFTGTFRSVADLDPGIDVLDFTSNGETDIFIMKLTNDILGLEENEIATNIHLYPNPSSEDFTISLGQTFQKAEIYISNSLGQQIISKTEIETNQIEIKIQGESGIYFCKIILDGINKGTMKIIKN